MRETIDVLGERHDVSVQRRCKTFRIAAGEYMGHRTGVGGEAETQTLADWCEQATRD